MTIISSTMATSTCDDLNTINSIYYCIWDDELMDLMSRLLAKEACLRVHVFPSVGLLLSEVISVCYSASVLRGSVLPLHGHGVASSMGYGGCLSWLCYCYEKQMGSALACTYHESRLDRPLSGSMKPCTTFSKCSQKFYSPFSKLFIYTPLEFVDHA